MDNKPLSDEQITATLKAFEKALSGEEWESSAFLRVIKKKLEAIEGDFKTLVDARLAEVEEKESHHHTKRKPAQKQQVAFVLLYSSQGTNIRSWEQILANLPRQIVSRPIYPDEGSVKAAIQAKKNKANHAYTSIFIHEEDVLKLPEDKTPIDKTGVPLITLKDNVLRANQIVRFVHTTGVYTYSKARLIKDSE